MAHLSINYLTNNLVSRKWAPVKSKPRALEVEPTQSINGGKRRLNKLVTT